MITSTTTPKPSRDPLQAQIEYIGANMVSRDEMALIMRDAVADGIKAAVADPALWTAAGIAMQQRATNATGGFVLSAVTGLIKKAWLLVLALALVYSLGGPGAALALLKAQFATGGHP